MLGIFRLFLFIVCFLASWKSPQAADDKRVALVIGNSSYQHTAPLRNPRNDAEDITAALKRLGFEVIEGIDLDKRSMERSIRQFGVKLAGAEVALFFYAGHGVQVSGQNYLLPTDARLSSEGDVDFESIALHLVLKQMEREAKTSLLLLDACRDNPLARNLARTMGTRSSQIGQGLAEVRTGVGTLISFSTQPGNVALDGTGRNSPYAAALLKHVETPGKGVSATLVNVRNEVVKATAGKQVPWEHTSLTGEIIFTAPKAEASRGNYDKEMEIAFWNAIKDSKSPDLLQTYVDRFPHGTFAGLARALMNQAEKEKAANQDVARRDDELKRAEEAKLAAEQQKRDAERKTAEAKLTAELRKAQEDAKKAREALLVAEKEREIAVKSADAARKVQQDAQKSAQTIVASIPVESGPVDDTALVRGIQRELSRVGCNAGKEDGKWGAAIAGAIEKYNRAKRSALPSGAPSNEMLAALAAEKSRVCPLQCDADEREVGGRCVAKVAQRPKPQENAPARAAPARNPEVCATWQRCMSIEIVHNQHKCGYRPGGC